MPRRVPPAATCSEGPRGLGAEGAELGEAGVAKKGALSGSSLGPTLPGTSSKLRPVYPTSVLKTPGGLTPPFLGLG